MGLATRIHLFSSLQDRPISSATSRAGKDSAGAEQKAHTMALKATTCVVPKTIQPGASVSGQPLRGSKAMASATTRSRLTAPPQTYAPPDSVCSSAITTAESNSAPLTNVRRSNAQLSGSSACWPTPDTMRTTTKSWLTGDYGFRVGYFG